jgi:hypothetical protein
VVLLAAWFSLQVITNRFYRAEGIWRFGAGFSRTELPLAAAELIAELPRDVRVFNNYDIGSNLMYLAGSGGRPREVPIHTNSWAFPPCRRPRTSTSARADPPPLPALRRGGVRRRTTTPLIERLAADRGGRRPDRRSSSSFCRGPDGQLGLAAFLTRAFDVRAHVERAAPSRAGPPAAMP